MDADANQPHQIELETRNGLSQFDAVSRHIDEMKGALNLSPAVVMDLHREAMRDLHD